MLKHIEGMCLILCAPDPLFELRNDVLQYTELLCDVKGLHGAWALEDTNEFIAHTLARDFCEQCRISSDSRSGSGIDREFQFRCEPYGAQRPERIFFESLLRVTNGFDRVPLNIPKASMLVDKLSLLGLVRKCIDGEIPTIQIIGKRFRPAYLIWMACVRILPFLAVGRYLDDLETRIL